MNQFISTDSHHHQHHQQQLLPMCQLWMEPNGDAELIDEDMIDIDIEVQQPQSPARTRKKSVEKGYKPILTVRTQKESVKRSLDSNKHHLKTTSALCTRSNIVTFNEVSIREYPRCLGDNPSVSSGPPIRYVLLPYYLQLHGKFLQAQIIYNNMTLSPTVLNGNRKDMKRFRLMTMKRIEKIEIPLDFKEYRPELDSTC
jgi:hypothetical protein